MVDKFVPPIIQTSVDFRDFEELFCVFTHVASIYASLLEQKKAFNERKESERKKERKRSKERKKAFKRKRSKEFNSHRTGLGHKHGRRVKIWLR